MISPFVSSRSNFMPYTDPRTSPPADSSTQPPPPNKLSSYQMPPNTPNRLDRT